jgi:hypothetical protein
MQGKEPTMTHAETTMTDAAARMGP